MRIILSIIILLTSSTCFAQINSWEGMDCKQKVMLTPYIAEDGDSIGVIVCPGGSYFWLDKENEGHEVARWLQSQHISAFVLEYRTASVPAFIFHYRLLSRGTRYPDAQRDLERAMELIKSDSQKYKISPDKLGVLGFSAGGHLVMSSSYLFNKSENIPAFIAPIYPVVSMCHACTHKRSRRALLGDNKARNTILQDSLSLEKHISHSCPPIFLVNCCDDPIVNFHNSELLDSALTANNVNHKYIQYQTGGHGFGVSETKGSTESRNWKYEFVKWLNQLFEK